MPKIFLLSACFLLLTYIATAQDAYSEGVKKAESLYHAKQYRKAAEAYTMAFNAIDGKAYEADRYNAACSWSLAGVSDSAFYHLNRLVTKAGFTDLNQLVNDHDFDNIHADKRWSPLCAVVKENKDKAEANLDKHLVGILDTVFADDQNLRRQIADVGKQYGQQSKQMKDLWTKISFNDSVDLIKVTAILDKYGWPGPDLVGSRGSQTVFLVIQHSDIQVQDKYLPAMRQAVKDKKAQPSSLALLEDRVALRHGKKQIYGSQISSDKDGSYLAPLEDPDNVDKRRSEVGLDPLASYLQNFDLTWDLEAYKKQLPELEKRERSLHP
jgi:hypothetical protein